jgi:hypothetical protein
VTFLRLLTGDRWDIHTTLIGCLPPIPGHSTARLLARARIEDGPEAHPELTHGDAVALDHQLGTLADLTARTDPWTAARNLYGGDPR